MKPQVNDLKKMIYYLLSKLSNIIIYYLANRLSHYVDSTRSLWEDACPLWLYALSVIEWTEPKPVRQPTHHPPPALITRDGLSSGVFVFTGLIDITQLLQAAIRKSYTREGFKSHCHASMHLSKAFFMIALTRAPITSWVSESRFHMKVLTVMVGNNVRQIPEGSVCWLSFLLNHMDHHALNPPEYPEIPLWDGHWVEALKW